MPCRSPGPAAFASRKSDAACSFTGNWSLRIRLLLEILRQRGEHSERIGHRHLHLPVHPQPLPRDLALRHHGRGRGCGTCRRHAVQSIDQRHVLQRPRRRRRAPRWRHRDSARLPREHRFRAGHQTASAHRRRGRKAHRRDPRRSRRASSISISSKPPSCPTCPTPLAPRTNISPALDFDTDQTYIALARAPDVDDGPAGLCRPDERIPRRVLVEPAHRRRAGPCRPLRLRSPEPSRAAIPSS